MKRIFLPLFLTCLLVTACSEKKEVPPKTDTPNLTQTPDVGKIEQVSVKAKGMGITPGAAVNDALKTAIMQVNGVKVASNSVNVNSLQKVTANLDVETADGKDSGKATAVVQGQAFAEAIVSQSKGLVSSFKVLDIDQTGNNTYSKHKLPNSRHRKMRGKSRLLWRRSARKQLPLILVEDRCLLSRFFHLSGNKLLTH